MKKDIYYLLNQVKTDLAVYKIEEIEQRDLQNRTIEILCKLHARDAHTEEHDDKKTQTKKKKEFSLRKVLRAAAIFAAAVLSIGGVAYAATDGELFHYMFTFLSGGGIYETTERSITGEESTVTVVMGEASAVSEDGNTSVSGPLLFQDGRLYFTGDGGKTDITDKISEEEPYYIDIVDETGNTHKFIIGGRAESGCYGYREILVDSEGMIRGGVGSYGEKVDTSAPWRQKADEEVMNWFIQQP